MSVEVIPITPTLRVRIEYDEDGANPRTEFDNVGKIAYWDRSRYVLGDEPMSREELDELGVKIAKGELIGVPVYAYIHSGVVLKACEANPFSCRWDSGQSGFVYCTKEKAVAEWGNKVVTPKVREKALAYLKGEVETYSAYLGGECYGYVVERVVLDEDGDEVGVEVLDSCWGYLADLPYCREMAVQAAANFVEEDCAEPA